MANYTLYKSSDLITPFVVITENTIDSSTTSIPLVGKRKEAYGQPEQQAKIWQLENFANSVKPTAAMKGQEWFNSSDGKMYVCVNEITQTFEKVNKPLVSPSAPSGSTITDGDLWFNTTDGFLYVYNGATLSWINAGAGFSSIPTTVYENKYMSGITLDGVSTEMFVNGTSPQRLTIPVNSSWNFDIKIIGRNLLIDNEVAAINFQGVINRDGTTPALIGGVSKTILGISTAFTTADAVVTADTSNNSLKVSVTGQTGKTVKWDVVVSLTKVSN